MVAQIGTGGKLQFPYIMANGSAHLSYFLIFLWRYENISVSPLLFSRISHPAVKMMVALTTLSYDNEVLGHKSIRHMLKDDGRICK